MKPANSWASSLPSVEAGEATMAAGNSISGIRASLRLAFRAVASSGVRVTRVTRLPVRLSNQLSVTPQEVAPTTASWTTLASARAVAAPSELGLGAGEEALDVCDVLVLDDDDHEKGVVSESPRLAAGGGEADEDGSADGGTDHRHEGYVARGDDEEQSDDGEDEREERGEAEDPSVGGGDPLAAAETGERGPDMPDDCGDPEGYRQAVEFFAR